MNRLIINCFTQLFVIGYFAWIYSDMVWRAVCVFCVRSCVPEKKSWLAPPCSRSPRRSCWSVASSSWQSARSTCWSASSTSSSSSSTRTSPTSRRGKANLSAPASNSRMGTASVSRRVSGHTSSTPSVGNKTQFCYVLFVFLQSQSDVSKFSSAIATSDSRVQRIQSRSLSINLIHHKCNLILVFFTFNLTL